MRVLVTDTGVGIPADAMKHLFEKFFRVEQHKNMAKGTGLGLNLTRQMIEGIHKGRMIVKSELGKRIDVRALPYPLQRERQKVCYDG